MTVKDDAQLVVRLVTIVMPVMPVIMCIRRRAPVVVAIMFLRRPVVPAVAPFRMMPPWFAPAWVISIATGTVHGAGINPVLVPVVVAQVTLLSLFGSGLVVAATFSWPGQYGRAATDQCGAQK